MGRWRPPQKAGSPYITAAGYAALQAELKDAWPRRREVVAALAAAAAEGDRSENAEYIYRKKELGGIDRRIRYLQKRLPNLKVVRHSRAPEGVFFGAQLTLSGEDAATYRYHIVGVDEADPAVGKINVDSPLAQALMKKTVGDSATLHVAGAERTVHIESIDYAIEEE